MHSRCKNNEIHSIIYIRQKRPYHSRKISYTCTFKREQCSNYQSPNSRLETRLSPILHSSPSSNSKQTSARLYFHLLSSSRSSSRARRHRRTRPERRKPHVIAIISARCCCCFHVTTIPKRRRRNVRINYRIARVVVSRAALLLFLIKRRAKNCLTFCHQWRIVVYRYVAGWHRR